MAARSEAQQREMEDHLEVGGTQAGTLLGLPIPLTVLLGLLGYLTWINVTGWQGLVWAGAVVGPAYVFARIAVAHDTYGIAVLGGWLRTAGLAMDRGQWGGASTRSPLPARATEVRGMRHAG